MEFTPIEGSNYLIDVLVKNPLTGEFTQTGLSRTLNTPSGAPTALIPVLPISPLSGAIAGHFEGGSIRVDFIAPEHPASIRIIAWDTATGSTFATATIRGETTYGILGLGGWIPGVQNPAILYGVGNILENAIERDCFLNSL